MYKSLFSALYIWSFVGWKAHPEPSGSPQLAVNASIVIHFWEIPSGGASPQTRRALLSLSKGHEEVGPSDWNAEFLCTTDRTAPRVFLFETRTREEQVTPVTERSRWKVQLSGEPRPPHKGTPTGRRQSTQLKTPGQRTRQKVQQVSEPPTQRRGASGWPSHREPPTLKNRTNPEYCTLAL